MSLLTASRSSQPKPAYKLELVANIDLKHSETSEVGAFAALAIGGSARISLGRRLMAGPVRNRRQILRVSLVFILIEIISRG